MIINQGYIFVIFILNGFLIGILFDIFRILRKSFKTKDIVTYIEDILFWIITGIFLLYSVFRFNNGEIRLYMFIAILIGVLLYMLILSSYIIKINVKIITSVKNLFQKIFNVFFKPFKKLFDKIRLMITNIFKKNQKSIKN